MGLSTATADEVRDKTKEMQGGASEVSDATGKAVPQCQGLRSFCHLTFHPESDALTIMFKKKILPPHFHLSQREREKEEEGTSLRAKLKSCAHIHWPEFSHMVIVRCHIGWKMQSSLF